MIVNKPISDGTLGIDISHWQGTIDWSTVASVPTAWGPVEWAYAKASTGATGRDKRFYQNVKGAHAAGLPIGAYHWAAPTKPAAEDAANFIKAMEPVRGMLSLPPMIDVEQKPTGKYANPQAFRAWIIELVQRVMGAGYGIPIVYINAYFAQENLGSTKLGNVPIWVPQYNNPNGDYTGNEGRPKVLFETTQDWSIWQFTERGKVPGIKGYVDLNVLRPKDSGVLFPGMGVGVMLAAVAAGVVGWWIWSRRGK